MSSNSTDRFPEDALSDLFNVPEHPEAIPLYGKAIGDVLPPEHFLWQLQGAYPNFDLQLRSLYEAQAKFGIVPPALWPDSVLIPSDFYMNGVVIPQLEGKIPPYDPATNAFKSQELPKDIAQELQAMNAATGDRAAPPEGEPDAPAAKPFADLPEVEPLGHSVSPEAEAFGAEAVADYDGTEESYLRSEAAYDEAAMGEMGMDTAAGSNAPLDLTPDMYDEMASSVQSRIASASWEIYKDVIAYSPEDFQRISKAGPGLDDLFPAHFFRPFKSFSLWLSLAGQNFTMQGERCLGCFIYRGVSAANGHASLNAGFVSATSYFDYSIPLEPHATIGYIIESASEFPNDDPMGPPPTESEQRMLASELTEAWKKLLPIVSHIYANLPKCRGFQERKTPKTAVLRRQAMGSDRTNLWRWNEKAGAFELNSLPAPLSCEYRNEILRAFRKNEEKTPIEVAPDPYEATILH